MPNYATRSSSMTELQSRCWKVSWLESPRVWLIKSDSNQQHIYNQLKIRIIFVIAMRRIACCRSNHRFVVAGQTRAVWDTLIWAMQDIDKMTSEYTNKERVPWLQHSFKVCLISSIVCCKRTVSKMWRRKIDLQQYTQRSSRMEIYFCWGKCWGTPAWLLVKLWTLGLPPRASFDSSLVWNIHCILYAYNPCHFNISFSLLQ